MLEFARRILADAHVNAVIRLILIVYASLAAPALPKNIASWFDNIFFKIGFLTLLAYTLNADPSVAIIAAIGFVVSLHTLNKIKVNETVSKLLTTIGLKSKDVVPVYSVPEAVNVEEIGITGVETGVSAAAPIDMDVEIETISEEAPHGSVYVMEPPANEEAVSGYDGTIYTGALF